MRERHNEAKATVAGGGGSVQDNISQNTSRRWKEIPNCALIKIEMKCQACSGSTAAK